VPLHLRTNWDSYYLEILILTGIFVYFLNFFAGKSKNKKLATLWYNSHRTLLEENFSLVGDDMKMEMESNGLVKEAENTFLLWCSGRTCCEGMLVQLKFLKVCNYFYYYLAPIGNGSLVVCVYVPGDNSRTNKDVEMIC